MDKIKVDDVLLKKYFFTSTHIDANPKHTPNEKTMSIFSVDAHIEKLDDDEGRIFGISVRIFSDDEKSTNLPYAFDISAIANLIVQAEEFEPENAREACYMLGQQILIGAIREQLASQTGHGPWDTVQLRPVSNPYKPQDESSENEKN